MAVKRTPEQEAVVKNRGGTLLVSAAAGSGKTRVLVERLLDRILYEEKNINEFLIITFTHAAAEELRGRIAGELNEAQAAHPDNAHRSPAPVGAPLRYSQRLHPLRGGGSLRPHGTHPGPDLRGTL